MLTNLLCCLALALPTAPERLQDDPVQGTWQGSLQEAGSATSSGFTLGLSRGEEDRIEGALISESVGSALVTGRWVAMSGQLLLSFQFDQGEPAQAELILEGRQFEGTLSARGRVVSMRGERSSSERDPATQLRVDLQGELPQRVDLRGLDDALEEKLLAPIERELRDQKIVGLSMAIVLEGELRDIRSWGWEDYHLGQPSTGKTMYRWASVSKLLTSVLALRLEEARKLDLDADVRRYVPEFPEKRWPVSSRHILQHQSGIVHYQHGPLVTQRNYEAADPFRDRIPSLDKFKDSPLLFTPGDDYSYSTHAFVLLGAVLERAGEAPFRDQIQGAIAGPLAMTSFRPDYVDDPIPHRAVGYKTLGDQVIRGGDSNIAWKLPAGGYISNVGDMARFGLGLLDGSLLSGEAYERFIEPQSTGQGRSTRTGLGVRLGRAKGCLLLSHSGSQTKTATYLVACPEVGAVVALMSNSENTNLTGLGNELIALLIQE